MDNQNNDDFLYGGNEQPVSEYEQPVVENNAETADIQPELETQYETPYEPEVSENEPQQLPPYGQGVNNQNQYGQYNNYNQSAYNPYEQQNTKNTYGIVSLVTGIVSVVCCCSSILGLVVGIVAIICGIISINKKEPNKGFVIAGIVLGAIAVFLGIITIIICVYMFATGTIDTIINQEIMDIYSNNFPATPNY